MTGGRGKFPNTLFSSRDIFPIYENVPNGKVKYKALILIFYKHDFFFSTKNMKLNKINTFVLHSYKSTHDTSKE